MKIPLRVLTDLKEAGYQKQGNYYVRGDQRVLVTDGRVFAVSEDGKVGDVVSIKKERKAEPEVKPEPEQEVKPEPERKAAETKPQKTKRPRKA